MSGSPVDRFRRAAATRLDHYAILHPQCVYCGDAVMSRMRGSGETRHYDHFIPIEIIIRAREAYPLQRFPNCLLPCCRRCNGFAGSFYFSILSKKFNYLQWKIGDYEPRLRARVAAIVLQKFSGLEVPQALADIVHPMEEFRDGDYPILEPVRLDNGNWSIAQELAERALALQWNSQTPISEPSKTACSFSPDLEFVSG